MAGGIVVKVFSDRLVDLQNISAANGRAVLQAGQKFWMVPSDWKGNPLDVPNLHKPSFDRTPINQAYLDVQRGTQGSSSAPGSAGGTVGESCAMKLQLDYLSVMERAFRSRHATPIRCQLHAGARWSGHGNGQGVFGTVGRVAQDFLKAAGT